MKIAYVTNVRMPTEKAHGIQIAKACEAFARAGHSVELIVPNRRNPIRESAFAYYRVEENFKIRNIFALDFVGWGRLGFLIETFSFALSAVFIVDRSELVYGRDETVLAVLAFFGARNIVWESHDGVWNNRVAYVTKRARAVVVVTPGAKDFYVTKGISSTKLLAVSNGVDVAAFSHSESKEVARKRLGLSQDTKIALYIGRLDGWKGADTLLEAAKLLTSDIRVAVVGGEPAQVTRLKDEYPQVFFLGYRPYREIADNQAVADVLIVPNTAKNETSMRFTSPLKLLAHLASHRPIVASDVPTLRDIAGDAAFYVAPDDPHALARGIEQVLSDGVLSAHLVAEAEKIVSRYDWSVRAAHILSFIA